VRWTDAFKAPIDLTHLKLIIEGIDTRSVRHLKRHRVRKDPRAIAHPAQSAPMGAHLSGTDDAKQIADLEA
jgi:hypothetical protein